MICPHCGLGGTVGDQYYLKKVRCPDCLKVFRVTEDVAVDPIPQPSAEITPSDADLRRADSEGARGDSKNSEALEPVSDDSGLKECVVCGFSFSSDFIRVIDGRQICPVCAN